MGATSSDASNESNAIEISGKILVAAIIFLFMVVFFIIFLHLYAKWFWWRIEEETTAPPPRRRQRRRRFVFAPGQDSYTRDGTQQIGLDPEVLRFLPLLVLKPENFKDGLECSVCLSEIAEGEKLRLLPKCNHGFHVDCIDMWFHSHSTCPLCRSLVVSESSKPISNAEGDFLGNSESSEAENLGAMSGLESIDFPTNVLVWGNQNLTQVSSVHGFMEEGTSEQNPTCSSLSTASPSRCDDSGNGNSGCHGMLVIDIPSEFSSSSLSPSSESRCAEDEIKSPMTAKLKSFKRLLSRDKKLSTCSPGSMDVEQA